MGTTVSFAYRGSYDGRIVLVLEPYPLFNPSYFEVPSVRIGLRPVTSYDLDGFTERRGLLAPGINHWWEKPDENAVCEQREADERRHQLEQEADVQRAQLRAEELCPQQQRETDTALARREAQERAAAEACHDEEAHREINQTVGEALESARMTLEMQAAREAETGRRIEEARQQRLAELRAVEHSRKERLQASGVQGQTTVRTACDDHLDAAFNALDAYAEEMGVYLDDERQDQLLEQDSRMQEELYRQRIQQQVHW